MIWLMPIVSNTSPILNLALTGHLSLLHEQFGEVAIPAAVGDELRVEENLPGSPAVREAVSAGWIRVTAVKNRALVQVLPRELDQGESEASALALQLQAEWTLLDEREGRRVAKSPGLKVTGVLGVLLRAWHEGKLPALRESLDELRRRAGEGVR
jgi:predicted nucleic acid-binding protein